MTNMDLADWLSSTKAVGWRIEKQTFNDFRLNRCFINVRSLFLIAPILVDPVAKHCYELGKRFFPIVFDDKIRDFLA